MRNTRAYSEDKCENNTQIENDDTKQELCGNVQIKNTFSN